MSKDSSARFYKNNTERLLKEARKIILNLSKEEKENSDNMVLNGTKIYHKIKKKSLLNIEKKYYKTIKTVLL